MEELKAAEARRLDNVRREERIQAEHELEQYLDQIEEWTGKVDALLSPNYKTGGKEEHIKCSSAELEKLINQLNKLIAAQSKVKFSSVAAPGSLFTRSCNRMIFVANSLIVQIVHWKFAFICQTLGCSCCTSLFTTTSSSVCVTMMLKLFAFQSTVVGTSYTYNLILPRPTGKLFA